ncbi:MAG: type II secretion system protein [Gemmatimonadales bacterium]
MTASRKQCRNRPRGFTLIELAVVLSILGIAGAAIGMTLLRQQRFYRGASELMYSRQSVRDAIELLSTDIRGASVTDTVRLLADSAIELFTNIGSSVLCQSSGSEVGLPGAAPAPGNTLSAFLFEPDTGDIALFYGDSTEGTGGDSTGSVSRWERHRIEVFSRRLLASACPASAAFAPSGDLSGNGATGFVMTLRAPLSQHVGAGAPVRFVRRGRYSLYKASDGDWYLGYRRCNAEGPRACGVVQPLSGPYRPYSPDSHLTGLLFEYFDAQGTRLGAGASPLAVARVDITARAQSSQRLLIEGRSWTPRDSATLSIAVRNGLR